MKKAILLHGTGGSPEGNWFRWLEAELRADGYEVWLPQLPHTEQPNLVEMAEFVRQNCPFGLDEDTLVVGHSSGATLALYLALQPQMKLKNLVLVSVFVNVPSEIAATRWEANARLFDGANFGWQQANRLGACLLVHSDDDPYIPLEHAEWIAEKLQAELIVLPGQGHFNTETSPAYNRFPKLLAVLKGSA